MNIQNETEMIELNKYEMISISGGSLGEWIGCKIAGTVNAIRDWKDRFILEQNDFEHNPIT